MKKYEDRNGKTKMIEEQAEGRGCVESQKTNQLSNGRKKGKRDRQKERKI